MDSAAAGSSSADAGAGAPEDADAELAELHELLEQDDDPREFEQDATVQEALSKGIDLRQYAHEVETALRAVERDSIEDYIKEADSLGGLHTQIRDCDSVLDSMESMLRGFQGDLASISAQIKFLQDESLAMNVKLRNRKSAEGELSSFIQQIVVPPDLISSICEGEVNEAYLEYVIELNKKVAFARKDSTAMTSACADIAPELEKLRIKSVHKIRNFLLARVDTLKKKFTNIQILQQSALLKYNGLYQFLGEHSAEMTAEVKEAYTTTMSAIYLRHIRGYLSGLMQLRLEVATKGDLLGIEEWSSLSSFSASSLFSSKPGHARGDGAFKLGERRGVLEAISEPPTILAHVQQAGTQLHYEVIFRSVSALLLDTVGSENDFMREFFGETEGFDGVFGKCIFHCVENLESVLVGSWDAIGCLLLLQLNAEMRSLSSTRQLTLLNNFFQRVQVLVWSRFKCIMEAHVHSLSAYVPKAAPEVHPHFVARRYAELVGSLRLLQPQSVEPMLSNILRALRTELERLLTERLASHHTNRKAQAAFLINNYDTVVSILCERGARGEDSAHFEALLDSVKAVFVEEELDVGHGRMIAYVKQTEPLLMQGSNPADAARVDKGLMETLMRTFHDTWKEAIEAINNDVVKSFASFKLGNDNILKQVLTQLLLYYTRFLDLVKQAFPEGAPFARYTVSIPTLMNEMKQYSKNF